MDIAADDRSLFKFDGCSNGIDAGDDLTRQFQASS